MLLGQRRAMREKQGLTVSLRVGIPGGDMFPRAPMLLVQRRAIREKHGLTVSFRLTLP